MRAKQYLSQLQKLDVIIEQKLQELDELKRLNGLKSIDYSQEKVSSSPSCCANFEMVVIKMVDMEQEINTEIDKFIDMKHTIINQIQGLSNTKYIQVLYKRYVEYKNLEWVACDMGYTFQYVCLLHGKALKVFEEKFL